MLRDEITQVLAGYYNEALTTAQSIDAILALVRTAMLSEVSVEAAHEAWCQFSHKMMGRSYPPSARTRKALAAALDAAGGK